jgi:hypothetical protein
VETKNKLHICHHTFDWRANTRMGNTRWEFLSCRMNFEVLVLELVQETLRSSMRRFHKPLNYRLDYSRNSCGLSLITPSFFLQLQTIITSHMLHLNVAAQYQFNFMFFRWRGNKNVSHVVVSVRQNIFSWLNWIFINLSILDEIKNLRNELNVTSFEALSYGEWLGNFFKCRSLLQTYHWDCLGSKPLSPSGKFKWNWLNDGHGVTHDQYCCFHCCCGSC